MNLKQHALSLLGLIVLLKDPRTRDERGLSQSAENAILLAGAVAIALGIITFLTAYVTRHMPKN
ncbi:MAG: hypothetical protein JWP61_2088 [Friedmanniella sp.]|nr:hypothetical protein [Friedmanniella sp.]